MKTIIYFFTDRPWHKGGGRKGIDKVAHIYLWSVDLMHCRNQGDTWRRRTAQRTHPTMRVPRRRYRGGDSLVSCPQDGAKVGAGVGFATAAEVGTCVGAGVGFTTAAEVGTCVGLAVGNLLGKEVGSGTGTSTGGGVGAGPAGAWGGGGGFGCPGSATQILN